MTNEEIDVLIAEKVMGWTKYPDPLEEFLPNQGWDAPEAKCGVCPKFSTDPAASKMLREKMRADGWGWQLMNGWNDSDFVLAGFTRRLIRLDGWVKAGTEERAVALAALRAVGVEVSE